ncbi:MAG: glycosyl hydrolase family 28-related protein [Terracidiphilus sp.]
MSLSLSDLPTSGKSLIRGVALVCVFFPTALSLMGSSSYYPVRLDDPKAVYLAHNSSDVSGDGVADDSAAIQNAIDQVQDTYGEGIVFISSGRYRISKTIYVWPGIRIIGYGPTRPVFYLAKDTPGFQDGIGYMVFYAGGRPGHERAWSGMPRGARSGANAPARRRMTSAMNLPFPGTVPPTAPVIDANPGTFYSAMSNIDFEIGDGNPAAVAIRFHVAQHCYLAHMDFHVGSGLAALHDVGNEAEDLHFYGGQYGIMTRKPSPGWQFTLLDSTFEGQSVAAIKEHEAGLTLIRDRFLNVPEVVAIDAGYSDELWIKDARFEHVSGPAITISNEKNARTEINLESILCNDVPSFAFFRESGKKVTGPAGMYRVDTFSHGLTMLDTEVHSAIETAFHTTPLEQLPHSEAPAIRDLPARDTWVNLRSLGAKGDGTTDDTAAIQKAIDEHSTIYVPMGRYLVSDTIRLKPDTVLIGLHPSATQFDLADESPEFQGPGAPKPLLEVPPNGRNIVTGIGIFTGGKNSRAVGAMWMAGEDSLLDDVRFLGGHGTNNPDGTRSNPYNNTHTADPDLSRRWDGQYPSLWITNGGGGTFANIWTPDTFAQAGMYISNTDTKGHVYELSSEHHVRNEVKLNHVSNWEIFALQTEEERGEGPFALPLEIDNSRNVLIANYHSYRVVSTYQPFPYTVRISNSRNIRFRNLHVYSDCKASFDNSVDDQTHAIEIRQREIGSLTFSGKPATALPIETRALLEPGAKVQKLAGGFFNVSGGAVDGDGQLYFVDAHWQRIYRWSPETRRIETIRDNPLDPVNLAFDRSGNLMVFSYVGDGTVYSFRPDSPEYELTLLKPAPAGPHPGATAVLPVDYWRNENDFLQAVPLAKPFQYISPDGTTIVPAGEDFVKGELYYGTKMADVLRAFGLGKAVPGKPFYVTDESEEKTYSANVDANGTLTGLKLFAEQGGESVATDAQGNVYIAAGNIFVYDPHGGRIGTIEVPERPIDLVFGGKDGRTLFILARTSLYSARIAQR